MHDSRSLTEEMLIAVHESGHCIGHLAVGWPFAQASIIPTGDTLGHVAEQDGIPRPSDELRVVVCLAGTLSVDRFLGSPCGWVPRDSAMVSDWAQARLLLKKQLFPSAAHSPEDRASLERLIKRIGAHKLAQVAALVHASMEPEEALAIEAALVKAARTAWRLVRRYWPAIEAVAGALLDRKTLSYSQCVEVFRNRRAGVESGMGRQGSPGPRCLQTRTTSNHRRLSRENHFCRST